MSSEIPLHTYTKNGYIEFILPHFVTLVQRRLDGCGWQYLLSTCNTVLARGGVVCRQKVGTRTYSHVRCRYYRLCRLRRAFNSGIGGGGGTLYPAHNIVCNSILSSSLCTLLRPPLSNRNRYWSSENKNTISSVRVSIPSISSLVLKFRWQQNRCEEKWSPVKKL